MDCSIVTQKDSFLLGCCSHCLLPINETYQMSWAVVHLTGRAVLHLTGRVVLHLTGQVDVHLQDGLCYT